MRAAVGGVRPTPARAVPHPRRAACTRPTPRLALRNARDLYTRRQEGVSIWVVPAGCDHRVQPGREGRLLRPGRRQGLPAPHLLRGTRRGDAPVTADRREYLLRVGRRCADRGAAAGRMVGPCARDGRGRRAVEHRARPARGGPAAAQLRRRAEGRPDEDELAYLRDRPRVPQLSAGRAARRRWSREGAPGDFAVTMAKLLFLGRVPAAALRAAGRLDGRPAGRRSPPRRVKESAYHLDHAYTVDSPARRRDRGVATPDAGGVDDVWPYTHELFVDDDIAVRLRGPGRSRCRRPSSTVDVHCGGTLAEATLDRPADGWAPTGGRDGRHTEHLSYLLAEMQVLHRAHPGATLVTRGARWWRRWSTRRSGWSPSRSSASCAAVRSTVDGRVTVTITPTYAGLPGDGRDPGRHPARAGRRRLPRRRGVTPCSRRPGPPTMISEAGRAKLAAAGIAPPGPVRLGPVPRSAVGALPALRLARHRAAARLRLDRVQGAVALPRLPRALRRGETAVTAGEPTVITTAAAAAPAAASTTVDRSPPSTGSPTTRSRSPSRYRTSCATRSRSAPAST